VLDQTQECRLALFFAVVALTHGVAPIDVSGLQIFGKVNGGYTATVVAYGYRFAVSYVNSEIRAHGLGVSQYRRHGWKLDGAHKAAIKAIQSRLDELGDQFKAKHRALYPDGEAA
jgi:hypothetical protein